MALVDMIDFCRQEPAYTALASTLLLASSYWVIGSYQIRKQNSQSFCDHYTKQARRNEEDITSLMDE